MTDWPEIIKGAIERSLDGLHTSIPAEIVAYNTVLQQATVQPVIAGMPAIDDVPIAWPRGGGQYLHLPLAAGDHVLLIFCEKDFGPWRLLGGAQAPALLRRHGLFAYGVPGAATDLEPLLTPTLFDGVVLGSDGGLQLRIGASTVELGAFPATQAVALATLVDTAFASIAAWAADHTHLHVPGPGTTQVPTGPAVPVLAPPAPVASLSIKVSA